MYAEMGDVGHGPVLVANGPDELATIFAETATLRHGQFPLLTSRGFTVEAGDPDREYKLFVEHGAQSLDVHVVDHSGQVPVRARYELESPSGQIYPQSSVEKTTGGLSSVGEVSFPEPGGWILRIFRQELQPQAEGDAVSSTDAPIHGYAYAAVEHVGPRCDVYLESHHVEANEDSIRIEAQASTEWGPLGAGVSYSATVQGPGEVPFHLSLDEYDVETGRYGRTLEGLADTGGYEVLVECRVSIDAEFMDTEPDIEPVIDEEGGTEPDAPPSEQVAYAFVRESHDFFYRRGEDDGGGGGDTGDTGDTSDTGDTGGSDDGGGSCECSAAPSSPTPSTALFWLGLAGTLVGGRRRRVTS